LPEWISSGYRIFFGDEAKVSLCPEAKKRWYPKGSKPLHIVDNLKKKINIIGASCGLDRFLMFFEENINWKLFRKFLKGLSRKYGKIVLILDNAKPHIARKTREYAGKLRIILEFLPSYSPELNPQEDVWRFMRLNETWKWHEDMDDLKCGIRKTIRKCPMDVNMSRY